MPREVTFCCRILYRLASNFRTVVINAWIPRSCITGSNITSSVYKGVIAVTPLPGCGPLPLPVCAVWICRDSWVDGGPKRCQQGGHNKANTTDKLRHLPHRTKRRRQQDLPPFPCSWDLWSLTGTLDTSSSSQP